MIGLLTGKEEINIVPRNKLAEFAVKANNTALFPVNSFKTNEKTTTFLVKPTGGFIFTFYLRYYMIHMEKNVAV